MSNADRDMFEDVDRALRALPDPVLPSGLRHRVMRLPHAPARKPWSLAVLLRAFWPQAIGLAAASVLGLMTGFADPGLIGTQNTDLTPYILALDTGALPSLTEESFK